MPKRKHKSDKPKKPESGCSSPEPDRQDSSGSERESSYTFTHPFNQVEVQILVFKNTLVKVEVLTKLLSSSQSKEALKCTSVKSTHN